MGVSNSNEIGDTIGGIMGPAAALIAAALSFFAFWAQYDANLEQRRQFEMTIQRQKYLEEEQKLIYDKEQAERSKEYEKEQERLRTVFFEQQQQFEKTQKLQQQQILLQDKRTRLDLFENKFYMMLSIHRDNVNGMDLNGITGRKVFLHLINELRFLYRAIKSFYDKAPETASPGKMLSAEEIYQVAYLSFFMGIGEKSTPLVLDLVDDSLVAFVENCHTFVSNLADNHEKRNDKKYAVNTAEDVYSWEKVHTLGVGHLRRLSHYIRHLFQTVKFVDDQNEMLLSVEQKYEYLTNLRAQLSTFEQLLLYYNSLSVLGEPWLSTSNMDAENYLTKYCMVKSMPLNSADFYKKPADVLPQTNKLGKPVFEWIEIRNRMRNVSKGTP